MIWHQICDWLLCQLIMRTLRFSKFSQLGGFHCHAITNKISNHSIQKVQNLGNKRRYICKRPRLESGLCDISYARYLEKRFTQIYKALYEAPFLRKIGKLKISLNVVEGPMEIMQIGAYSKCSYEKTKANLKLIFTGFFTQFSKFPSSYIIS